MDKIFIYPFLKRIVLLSLILQWYTPTFTQEGTGSTSSSKTTLSTPGISMGTDKSTAANCDSLNPNRNILTLDTVLKSPSNVLLVPKYGTVDGLWSPINFLNCTSCQTPTAYPERNIVYSVNLRDEYQCIHVERFQITLEVTVKNVITPNGDGINDCLKIVGLPVGTPLKIYDKSGLLVYSTDAYNDTDCWEGTDNGGRPLVAGTYWYVLDNPWTGIYKKGFILIVR
jgi:gliding motility-associated-like protein